MGKTYCIDGLKVSTMVVVHILYDLKFVMIIIITTLKIPSLTQMLTAVYYIEGLEVNRTKSLWNGQNGMYDVNCIKWT